MSFGSAVSAATRAVLIAAATGAAVFGLLVIVHPFVRNPGSPELVFTDTAGADALHRKIDAARQALRATEAALDKADAGSPSLAPGTDTAAQKLFGTPGGIYTAADIKANGPKTPEEKYRGIKSSHNTDAKAGDKICPISETLANPQFTWVVGGKTYEFCCVPCIEEFVSAAKEKPESIQPPDSYRKK